MRGLFREPHRNVVFRDFVICGGNVRARHFLPPRYGPAARADVSKRFLKSVAVLRPGIGPIAEVLQAEIGIIGRALLAGPIREKVTPGCNGLHGWHSSSVQKATSGSAAGVALTQEASRSSQIRLWAAHSSIVVIGRGHAWLRLSAHFGVAPSYHIFMGDPETQSGLR